MRQQLDIKMAIKINVQQKFRINGILVDQRQVVD